jgi:oligopeptide transport system ATP-binding protein
MERTILDIQALKVGFSLGRTRIWALRGVSLPLLEGESLAVVGESGSGKSVLVKACMGLLEGNGWIEGGQIWYNGKNLALLQGERAWLPYRGTAMAMVMQDPMTSLNPVRTAGAQMMETLRLHQGLKGAAARDAAAALLADVGMADPYACLKRYPHELSGGMRQRVVIAMALACRPRILFCDEPTTALDVTVQAQILDLLERMKEKYRLSLVYITHDLGVVARCAQRVAVMYAGQIVELGLVREIFYDARHPYTWALLASLPQRGVRGQPLYSLPGTPPVVTDGMQGDPFAPRNPYALAIDYKEEPPAFPVSPTHWARTWLMDPRAPRIMPPALQPAGRLG